MPKYNNNKQTMYGFEKIALIIALVITVAIVLLVVFGTGGIDLFKWGNSKPNNDGSVAASTDSADSNDLTSTVLPDREIEFTTIKYSNTKLNEGTLILVGQSNKYEKGIKDELENVYSYNRSENPWEEYELTEKDWFGMSDVSQRLHKEAIDQFNLMYKDYYEAFEENDVTVKSTYKSVDEQQSWYENKLEKVDVSERDFLQAGGESEHHTGYALHVDSGNLDWFYDNCYKYGFVQRYPDGREGITHVKDEKNHFRYVGIPHSVYMKLNGNVLEDYISELENRTYNNRLSLDDGTSTKYEAYAVKASTGAETEIKVPAESSGWKYLISGTNDGYFIVTIYKTES